MRTEVTVLEQKLETLRCIAQTIRALSEVKDRDEVTAYSAQKNAEELGKLSIKIVESITFDSIVTVSPMSVPSIPKIDDDVPF